MSPSEIAEGLSAEARACLLAVDGSRRGAIGLVPEVLTSGLVKVNASRGGLQLTLADLGRSVAALLEPGP